MGFFGRTLAGGVAGGLLGGMSTGDLYGAAGGAAGGALMGGLGVNAGRRMLNTRGGLGGMAQKGYGAMVGGISKAESFLGTRGGRVGSMYNRAMPYGRREALAGGLMRGGSMLAGQSSRINKYGGYALGSLGVASAAHIGSSVLSSNRGY